MPGTDNRSPNHPKRTAHGHSSPVPIDALLGDDPDLWLVTGDMRAWSEAHPCGCDAICVCDRAV